MIRRRRVGWMMTIAALAACGAEGGELREATERRRAQGIGEDTAVADTAAEDRAPGRIPAFVLLDSAPPAAADSAPAADTAQAAASAAERARQQWTAGVRDVVRTMAGPVVLRDVRVGVNQGFDRVVLEFLGGAAPGYRVEYVDRPVRQCGSGEVTRVAGDAWLAITLRGAQAHDERGRATVQARERRLNMDVVQEMAFTCDFEGVVQIVFGVSSPNPYRITELQNPTRLIVDVQQ